MAAIWFSEYLLHRLVNLVVTDVMNDLGCAFESQELVFFHLEAKFHKLKALSIVGCAQKVDLLGKFKRYHSKRRNVRCVKGSCVIRNAVFSLIKNNGLVHAH